MARGAATVAPPNGLPRGDGERRRPLLTLLVEGAAHHDVPRSRLHALRKPRGEPQQLVETAIHRALRRQRPRPRRARRCRSIDESPWVVPRTGTLPRWAWQQGVVVCEA